MMNTMTCPLYYATGTAPAHTCSPRLLGEGVWPHYCTYGYITVSAAVASHIRHISHIAQYAHVQACFIWGFGHAVHV